MAEVNTDGSKASAAQRVGNFLGNGGGLITSRSVMIATLPIVCTLIGLVWSDLKDGQKDTRDALAQIQQAIGDHSKGIAINSTRIDGVIDGQRRIWLTLGAHAEHIEGVDKRLTSLESCQPNCHPR